MSRFRTARLLVAPLVALAVVGLVGTFRPQTAAALDLNRALLVTSRSDLQICVDVDGVDADARREASAEIRRRLSELAAHPRWTTSGYDRSPTAVAQGCPQRGAHLASNEAHESNRGPAQIFATTSPSPFRLFVIVTTPGAIARMFGDGPNTVAAQESMCVPTEAPTDCFEVTTALYVTKSQLSDPDFTRGLLMGIGLEPTVPRIDDPGITGR